VLFIRAPGKMIESTGSMLFQRLDIATTPATSSARAMCPDPETVDGVTMTLRGSSSLARGNQILGRVLPSPFIDTLKPREQRACTL